MFIRYSSFIFLFLICNVSTALECTKNKIDVGQYPFDSPGDMILSNDNQYAFVLDTRVGNVNIIDIAEKIVAKAMPVSSSGFADELVGIALDTTQQRLYVSEYFSGNLHTFSVQGDIDSFELSNTTRLDADGLGVMTYDESSQKLFVADKLERILVLDNNLQLVSSIPAINSARLIYDLLVMDNKLFVSFESGGVLAVYDISQTEPSLLKEISVESSSTGLAAAPNGNKVYVAHKQANKVSVINTDTLVVAKKISSDLFSNLNGLAYLNGHIWSVNENSNQLVPIDTNIDDVLSVDCPIGEYPKHLLPINDNRLYVSHSLGVDEIIITEQATFITVEKGASSAFLELITEPEAPINIVIEGGVGPFTLTTVAGMKAELSADKRQWRLTAPILFGQHKFSVRDDGNGDSQTRFIRVGSQPLVSPSGPISLLLGQHELFSVSGGFPAYSWTTQAGVLSANFSKQVLYVPRVTGGDVLTLLDAMGNRVSVEINVLNELTITPLIAVMLRGEERDFQALGGSDYRWTAPLGGELSSLTGEQQFPPASKPC